MYNDLSAKRQQRMQEAYHCMELALEYVNDAIYDEFEEVELSTLERVAERIQDLLDECVTYVNVPSEEDLVDEFLYGK